MGKATGFLEYPRVESISIDPKARTENFNEFHPPLKTEKRRQQAARCMNCGVPFCQSGAVFGGMVSGCPLHNLIPEWNDGVYRDSIFEALTRLRKTNNFPEFTGRVCPALCEAACTCGLNGDPVTVRENELYIAEKGYAEGWTAPRVPAVRSGKKVAVVGSGPAGLAVADQLNQRGHLVTVFEKQHRPGGLLMYGIPNMKLDKSVVSRRVRIMEEEGIVFKTGVDIGRDITPQELENTFDAVVLCCGSKKPRDISAPGREAEGIYFAVDFLSDATEKVIGDKKDFSVSARGKDVIIVGGGDTGNDCLGTCIRQGCSSVLQLEMMAKLPDKRDSTNPWPQWPRVRKTDYGQEEAIALFGKDPRVYETTAKEFIADERGHLTAVVTVGLEFKKDSGTGKTVITQIDGSEKTVPCQLLLIAAGFTGCEDYVIETFGTGKNQRGCIETEKGKYSTGIDGVFTAGDARRGQSLVVWAIAEGRACAEEVDDYLMGYTNMV